MAARLILNADDFGLTPGINRAIAELHIAGVLTSATLMANGRAFDDAVEIARQHPELGIGCHIVLTDGLPLSRPDDIRSLLEGRKPVLRPKLWKFVLALLTGRISEDEIAIEALAQIRRLQRAGVRITHLDTHKHTHLFPSVLRPLLRVARQTGIPAIRNPFEPSWAGRLRLGSRRRGVAVGLATLLLRPRFRSLLRRSAIVTTGGTLAISATGDLNPVSLMKILNALPQSGTFELCCHPGYNTPDLDRIATRLRGHRETERKALLAVLPQILSHPNAPRLIHYGDVPADPVAAAESEVADVH